MAGFGQGARRHPRSRGVNPSRTGPDSATLAIIGVVCAVAGLFVAGIILGPAAVVCGWLAMGRTWKGASAGWPALVAVVLGAIDTVLALIALAGAGTGAGIL
ncbi:small hydrophobic protein [Streptomyces fragilis]|uniref:Small hydrophobic protein n=1 Tax=Streptomyces fragilis TaxID=67301 RepID=A0ABV2YB12_9ACTN|nr:small hydrophobic protein [Streptomyces fragilis]